MILLIGSKDALDVFDVKVDVGGEMLHMPRYRNRKMEEIKCRAG